jgi:hypothetical protein
LARTLTEEELPVLDRPLRFVVTRGQRGAVRAATLEGLQELLEGPWTPNETPWNEASQNRESQSREPYVMRSNRTERDKPRGGARGGSFARSGNRNSAKPGGRKGGNKKRFR